MAGYTVRKRPLEWWREAGEVPDENRLEEAYDASRVKVGSDGRNGPDIKKAYTKGAERKFDDLGNGSEHPKKGSSDGSAGDKVPAGKDKFDYSERKAAKAKSVREGFEEEPLDDGSLDDEPMDQGPDAFDGGDVNPESDIPPDVDDFDGGEDSFDGGDEACAEDITVEIGGQRYKLVPADDEMGDEGLPGGEGGEMGDLEGGDAGMDMPPAEPDSGAPDENAIAAEDDDVTKQESAKAKAKKVIEANKKLAAKPANDAVVQERIKKALEMKRKATKELQELFTGAYVTNKQGDDVGLDFSMIGGDDEFSVKAPAASGKQYTPSFPVTDGNGMKKVEAKNKDRKAAFDKWIAEQEKKLSEADDPGKTSEDFNKGDLITKTSISPMNPEEFPQMPEILGSEPDLISQYKKTEASRAKRRAVQESDQPVKFPSKEVKDDVESGLNESFDFKALMSGKYSKRLSE